MELPRRPPNDGATGAALERRASCHRIVDAQLEHVVARASLYESGKFMDATRNRLSIGACATSTRCTTVAWHSNRIRPRRRALPAQQEALWTYIERPS